MKILFIFVLFLGFSTATQAQSNSSVNLDTLDAFYHIDSVRSTATPGRLYPMTQLVNYVQIAGDQAVLSASSRGSFYYIFGEIDGYTSKIDEDGTRIQQFYIRGRQYAGGRIRSIEIFETTEGKVSIHYYSKFGGIDVVFSARKGNPSDIESFE
jgi:hypothetical protein